jgi:hypothetical protein
MDSKWLGIEFNNELATLINDNGRFKDRHMQYKLIHIVCNRMDFDNDEHLTTTLRFSACVEIHEDGHFAMHPALQWTLHSDDYFATSSHLWWYLEPFERSEGTLRLKEDANIQGNTCVCPSPAAVLIKATSMSLPQTQAISEQWKDSGRSVSFGYVACAELFDLPSMSSILVMSFQVLVHT